MTSESSSVVPTVSLRAGGERVPMPQLGFGVWQVPDEQVTAAVGTALRTGFRSIDTAAAYGNEAGVGRALAAAGLPRDEVFVTTKVWNDHHGYQRTLDSFEESVRRLGVAEPLDLFLIHWPVPAAGRFVDTFKALLELRERGRVRAVGTCNFRVEDLQRLRSATGEYPALNQVELHPWLQQRELRDFHAQHDIVTEAWSPLGQGGALLDEPVIGSIADSLGRTPAQVVIRWHLQSGQVVIPKSVTPARIEQNFDVFGFHLDDEAMRRIAALDRGTRLGPDPSTFGA